MGLEDNDRADRPQFPFPQPEPGGKPPAERGSDRGPQCVNEKAPSVSVHHACQDRQRGALPSPGMPSCTWLGQFVSHSAFLSDRRAPFQRCGSVPHDAAIALTPFSSPGPCQEPLLRSLYPDSARLIPSPPVRGPSESNHCEFRNRKPGWHILCKTPKMGASHWSPSPCFLRFCDCLRDSFRKDMHRIRPIFVMFALLASCAVSIDRKCVV